MRFEFREGSGIALGSECYRFVERIRDRHRSPVFRHVVTEEPKMLPDRDIEELINKDQIRFLSSAEISEVEHTGDAPNGPTVVFLEDIGSMWERNRADKLEKYLIGWDRFDRPPLSDAKLAPVIASVAREEGDDKPPSPRTLRRRIRPWLAKGCTLEGILSQVHLCGTKPQLPQTVREIVLDVIWDEYLTPERPAVTDSYESMKRRIMDHNRKQLPGTPNLTLPSLRQTYREIAKIDKFTVTWMRESIRAARLKFGPRYAGVELSKHNQRWELDSTVIDLMLIDAITGEAIGRPTITVVIDCYTRTVAGFYLGWEAESFATFVAAMRNALQPKHYLKELYPEIKRTWQNLGTVEVIAVDNNTAYTGNDCKAACRALGIDLQYTPVLKPWYRPIIERFFRTLTQNVFQRVPGTTFSNIFERNKEIPPETIAVATLEDMRSVVTKWIVDEYHYSHHRGIKTVPALMWDESTRLHATVPPPSHDRMDTALAMVIERVAHHYGIEWNGFLYNSADVANVRIAPNAERRVRIAVDTNNLAAIRMHDLEKGEWVRVPLVKPRLAPSQTFTLGQHALVKHLLETRTEEFMGEDSYRSAHDYVARYVEGIRPTTPRNERTRKSRFRFGGAPPADFAPTAEFKADAGAISDEIFDGLYNQPAPFDEHPTSDEPRADPEIEGSELSITEAPLTPDQPVATLKKTRRSKRMDGTPSLAKPLFISADNDIDLDAAATSLGMNTHKD